MILISLITGGCSLITGYCLKSIIEKEKLRGRPFTEIIFESSPFLRCLETASGIA